MTDKYDPGAIPRLVSEYLAGFHGRYRVPRHFDEESQLLEWCETIGTQYRDWHYYKGHPKDAHCALSIKDPQWCTLFELRWSHLVIGSIDKSRS